MKVHFFILLILQIIFGSISAAEWQWSVKVRNYISSETNTNPEAFLWIPGDCEQVRGIVVGQHNMCEETIFENTAFRKTMSDLDIAIIWITPGIDYSWDVTNGCQDHFDTMLKDLAVVSGYSELQYAPIVPIGHSAMATFPWNFAAWNADRTLAVISYCGDAPRTNLTGYGGSNLEWGRTRNIDGIPGLMIEGEYEWWEARVNPALAFRVMYPESCISFLCDAGHGHFDVSDDVVDYISMFIKKSAEQRLPKEISLDEPNKLIKINNKNGWLAERWHPDHKIRPEAAPYSEYEGDKHDAFWYFDEEIANLTEAYYASSRNKKMQYIGFVKDGHLLEYQDAHFEYQLDFDPEEDGLTFHVSAAFVDSTRTYLTTEHSHSDVIKINRICGPVEKINDTTFSVCFYRMGLNNPKRTGDIWLLANHRGDKNYKSAVQQLNLRIPYPNKEGIEQNITFDPIEDVDYRTMSVTLVATSDSGLPVSFYIKEGPARIIGNKLVFTKIPPRSKFPLKITVVAWQYGRLNGVKVQTADPKEMTFYLNRD